MFRAGLVALAWGAIGLSGCGCYFSWKDRGMQVYGGVSYDCDEIAGRMVPLGALVALVDFPFSFVADTLCLPVSLAVASDRSRTPRPNFTLLEGFITEDETPKSPGVEIIKSGVPRPQERFLSGAQVRVLALSRREYQILDVPGTTRTDTRGYFLLRHDPEARWDILRCDCPGYWPVDVELDELPRLSNTSYWEDHSLLIRMKKQ